MNLIGTFRLFTGNQLETLAEELAKILAKPLTSPLDQEIIVVQSKGMERWVSMELARRHGICANYRFPFPIAFIYEVFQIVIPHLPECSPYDPGIMTWIIMRLLPSCVTKPGFENLRVYLGEDFGTLKQFQLSKHIADTFDQYLLFRPEMILRWERGEEDHWQAALWKQLVEGYEKDWHRAALRKTFLKAVRESPNGTEGLPERVSVFGISSLPRFHIEILAAISRFVEVNLFLMNPCREYWGDILSDREMKRTVIRRECRGLSTQELHLEKGNSLLASMGKQGRDFFDLLNEFDYEEFANFTDPSEDHLLSSLQSDILKLRDRKERSDGKKLLAATDSSIQIHSCHSPMREVEVLHDQLLDIFEKDPSLLPRDILVMTPDIESYAPYIQAVFDVPTDDTTRIPFTISDRNIREESEVLDTFLAIFDLSGSRFGASQVAAILESRAVRRKFGLLDTDLDLIRRWIKDTRIRWGIDRQNRSRIGLPAFPQNTWTAGLERLLLGYAMPGQDEKMFAGILPYDLIEGGDVQVLGKVIEFAEQLFSNVTSLSQPRTLNGWSKALTGLLDMFFMSDEDTEGEMQLIRRAINDMGEMQEKSGFHEEVDANVIRWHLGHSLEREGFGFGFLTGCVTFCAMLPMRSIPFKVICLVGMNGNAYPRQSIPLGFDLMAMYPKPGDRSRRDDDRYLFLEAILSAREILYISYVGQSVRDKSLIPPSVLVSEIMDYIEEGFDIQGKERFLPDGKTLDRFITMHRLQAFNPAYFDNRPLSGTMGQRFFSYSEENCEIARCLLEEREPPVPFLSLGLSTPEEEWRTVSLINLCSFFSNPARFLLNKRLGIYLDENTSILEEREAFSIENLEKYLLEEKMVERKLEGCNLKDFLRPIRASGRLPHGNVGECIYTSMSMEVESFAEKTLPYMQGKTIEPLDVDLCISGFRLTGRIDSVYTDMLIQYRYARVKARDRLRIWIHHLVLNSLMADNYPRTSMLVCLRPKSTKPEWAAWEYYPLSGSKEILGKLLEIYWMGLVRQVHFFSESSWIYASEVLKKNRPPEDALHSAVRNWTGGNYNRGECEDPYYKLCFRKTDPLDSEFESLAKEVFGPLLEHQQEIL